MLKVTVTEKNSLKTCGLIFFKTENKTIFLGEILHFKEKKNSQIVDFVHPMREHGSLKIIPKIQNPH